MLLLNAGVSAQYMGKNHLTLSDFSYFLSNHDVYKFPTIKFRSGSKFHFEKFMNEASNEAKCGFFSFIVWAFSTIGNLIQT
jgi:hypothetical protein